MGQKGANLGLSKYLGQKIANLGQKGYIWGTRKIWDKKEQIWVKKIPSHSSLPHQQIFRSKNRQILNIGKTSGVFRHAESEYVIGFSI